MKRAMYWIVAAVFIAFGVLAIISIGAPFFLLGLTMVLIGPWRHRRRLFWGAIAGVLGFVAGYILVAPGGCRAMATSAGDIGHTVCTNILGIRYAGTGVYNPSLVPALAAGIVVAATVAMIVSRLVPPHTSKSALS